MQQSGTDELLAIFITEHSPNHRIMLQFNAESLILICMRQFDYNGQIR